MWHLPGLLAVLAMTGPGTATAHSPSMSNHTATTITQATRPAGAMAAAQTASQFYMAYRALFDKASTIDEILPFMASKNKAQIEATPAAERTKMFGVIKIMNALTDVKVVKEAPTASGATLTVEGLDSDKRKTTGTVDIVKENGAWKVGTERWTSS